MPAEEMSSPSNSSGTPVEETGPKTGGHVFNEQTNYVPKRTIITVCCCPLAGCS